METCPMSLQSLLVISLLEWAASTWMDLPPEKPGRTVQCLLSSHYSIKLSESFTLSPVPLHQASGIIKLSR